MPNPFLTCACVAALASAWAVSTAKAAELKGSFTGTTINANYLNSDNSSTGTFNGVGVTGTFDLTNTAATILNSNPANYSAYFGSDADSNLTFTLASTIYAGTYVFHIPPTSAVATARAQLSANNVTQSVRINSQQIPGDNYTDGSLLLVGQGFFDLANPHTLSPGVVDLAASVNPFSLGERMTFATGITLTSVTFDTAIPEPTSIAIILSGCATVLGIRNRRNRPRPPQAPPAK